MCPLGSPSSGEYMMQRTKEFPYIQGTMMKWAPFQSRKQGAVPYQLPYMQENVMDCHVKHDDVPSTVPFQWRLCDAVPYRVPQCAPKSEKLALGCLYRCIQRLMPSRCPCFLLLKVSVVTKTFPPKEILPLRQPVF